MNYECEMRMKEANSFKFKKKGHVISTRFPIGCLLLAHLGCCIEKLKFDK